MKGLFDRPLARVKYNIGNVYAIQLVNTNGEDIGYNGELVSSLRSSELWRNSGERIVRESKLNEFEIIKE